MALVSNHLGRNRSRDDDRLSSAMQFCSGKELLQTHRKIPPNRDLVVPPVDEAVCNGSETATVAALRPASSTCSATRMLISTYMSRSRYQLDGRRFLSITLDGARSYVVIQNS